MTNMPDSVIIMGASGFIGRNLVRALKPHVTRIVPVSVSGADVEGLPGHAFADLDTSKAAPGSIVINVAAYRYDAANFAAGQTEILLRNVEIAGKVYEFCVRSGITEVRAASSIAVYPADDANFDDAAPLDLNRDPHPGELMYGWSKRIGEIYGRLFAEKNGINTVAFRLTNPYGPFDSVEENKAHVVPAFVIRALTSTGPFTVRGNPRSQPRFHLYRRCLRNLPPQPCLARPQRRLQSGQRQQHQRAAAGGDRAGTDRQPSAKSSPRARPPARWRTAIAAMTASRPISPWTDFVSLAEGLEAHHRLVPRCPLR